MLWFCFVLLLMLSLFRIHLDLTKSRSLWQKTFTVAIVSLTMGYAGLLFQDQIEEVTGLLQVADLIKRLTLVVASVCVQIFILALKESEPRLTKIFSHVAFGGAVCVALVFFWTISVSKLTTRDLAPASSDPEVATYLIISYSCLLYCMVELCRFTAYRVGKSGNWFGSHHFGLTLVGVGSVLGGLSFLAFIIGSVTGAVQSYQPIFAHLGSSIFPTGVIFLAIGIFFLPILPWVSESRRFIVAYRTLGPLRYWAVNKRPEVKLPFPRVYNPAIRLRVRHQRAITEVIDALGEIYLDVSRSSGPMILAQAMRNDKSGEIPAIDALRSTTEAPVTDQMILKLAEEFSAISKSSA